LSSVQEQKHPEVEHILIDGASQDGTLGVIHGCGAQPAVFISEPDSGIYDALNKGLSYAGGDVLGILHGDDVFANPDVLSRVSRVFEDDKSIDVVIGDVLFVSSDNLRRPVRLYRSGKFRQWMFRYGFMPAHTATFIRKSFANQIGSYNLKYKSAGDFDYMLRLILIAQGRVHYFNEVLVNMSMGGVSSSGWVSYRRTTKELLLILREHKIYTNYFLLLLRLPVKFLGRFIFFPQR
jgi:glycosyltransferase involved in cell wall biosynthesis